MILLASAMAACGQNYKWTNFAGLPGTPGDVNGGTGTSRLNGTYGADCDSSGNVYIADRVNNKIKKKLQIKLNFVNLKEYRNYFNFLKQLGLMNVFLILTSIDKIRLLGNHLKPLIVNENNNKLIIFCHGISGSR